MKIKKIALAFAVASLPVAGAFADDAVPSQQTAEAMPTFTKQRVYFSDGASSDSVVSLARMLERARENGATRRVDFADNRQQFNGNGFEKLLWAQGWRYRVSRELEAALD